MSTALTLAIAGEPRFRAKVPIHVPGAAVPTLVEFEFVWLARDEYERFLKSDDDLGDLAYVMKIATGWELKDEFSERNVELLLQTYAAAAAAIVRTWCEELSGRKVGDV